LLAAAASTEVKAYTQLGMMAAEVFKGFLIEMENNKAIRKTRVYRYVKAATKPKLKGLKFV
jgi:hypothetical protein